MPNDRDTKQHGVLALLTPGQRIGYAVTLIGFLLFTLFTALVFGPVM